jgi:hypothetical protein
VLNFTAPVAPTFILPPVYVLVAATAPSTREGINPTRIDAFDPAAPLERQRLWLHNCAAVGAVGGAFAHSTLNMTVTVYSSEVFATPQAYCTSPALRGFGAAVGAMGFATVNATFTLGTAIYGSARFPAVHIGVVEASQVAVGIAGVAVAQAAALPNDNVTSSDAVVRLIPMPSDADALAALGWALSPATISVQAYGNLSVNHVVAGRAVVGAVGFAAADAPPFRHQIDYAVVIDANITVGIVRGGDAVVGGIGSARALPAAPPEQAMQLRSDESIVSMNTAGGDGLNTYAWGRDGTMSIGEVHSRSTNGAVVGGAGTAFSARQVGTASQLPPSSVSPLGVRAWQSLRTVDIQVGLVTASDDTTSGCSWCTNFTILPVIATDAANITNVTSTAAVGAVGFAVATPAWSAAMRVNCSVVAAENSSVKCGTAL